MIRTAVCLLVLAAVGAALAATADDGDEAAVDAVLAKYLATATWPGDPEFDPKIFSEDVRAWWSSGKTYEGRKAATAAVVNAHRELEREFVKFKPVVTGKRLVVKGDLAWVACNIDLIGELTKERGEFHKRIRSTFVFEKRDGRWRISHEHSSRLP